MSQVPFWCDVSPYVSFSRRSNVPLEATPVWYGFKVERPEGGKARAKFTRRGKVEDGDYADMDLMVVAAALRPEGLEVLHEDADYVLVSPNGQCK